jgi:hypothetical protein
MQEDGQSPHLSSLMVRFISRPGTILVSQQPGDLLLARTDGPTKNWALNGFSTFMKIRSIARASGGCWYSMVMAAIQHPNSETSAFRTAF